MGEEVSVEEEKVEGNDEEWVDWRDDEGAKVETELSGTDTRRAEDEEKTTETGFSMACAAEFPRFAEKTKTRSLTLLVPGSPRQSKTTDCSARAGAARQSKTT